MNKRLLSIAGGIAISLAAAGLAPAQDTQPTTPQPGPTKTTTQTTNPNGQPVVTTTTQTTSSTGQASTTVTQATQNADGTWTVVQYPVGQEVLVDLTPSATAAAVTPKAKVLRSADGTVITVDPAGFSGLTGTFNLYAVDPMGHLTFLGPIAASATAPISFKTPLDKFMLVVSPDTNLTTIAPTTTVAYRSAVPAGLSVIPVARSGEGPGAAVGEKVAATSAP
ncbi:MAG TPA: hypothetical protein VF507_09810, partial [Pyrinomonadaceae bacterium]